MAAFGWSAGDLVKLIEVSVGVYTAFNDARKNSSRQFQLLTDEFGRFHTCLELLRNLLEEHNKKLYFGHDQFKATLDERQEFLLKYSVLGDRRRSVVKFFKMIGWTNEEKGTINRLLTAVHGHTHVIGLYTGYMTLKTSLEGRAIQQETLNELRRFRKQPSSPMMPFIAEESEGHIAQDLNVDSAADGTAASKLEQVAKELDGFSHVLKRERDSWFSQHQDDMTSLGSGIMEEDEDESIEMDVTVLQTVLQEVEQKLEGARYGSKCEYNQHVVRRATHDSGIADMSTSPESRYNSPLLASPTIPARPGVSIRRLSSTPSLDASPILSSSPPTTCANTGANTAATTPMFTSPAWDLDTATRPPSIRLPLAAVDWSLFCNNAEVSCEGWKGPWPCKISQRRRTEDSGLSLRAEHTDGSCLYHDLPALGIAIPHTSQTGAYPHAKNMVTFKEPHGHNLRKVTGQGDTREREPKEKEPKYMFKDPADCEAFQELIYGCDLKKSWDIVSIKSDREKERVTQTVRLWRDMHTRIPVILFYTNNRKRSAKTHIQEPKTSFTDKLKAAEKKPTLRLDFSDQKLDKRYERASSVGSGASSVRSDRSGRSSAERATRLLWLLIEFASLADRDQFLSLWHG